ncbi:MAG: UTP--glucose-1-phosphate uridylyltransferase [Spirochaetota bacterium]|nr:UTP--glucose-1-phosphate uridylyltransferase [Spirochaetota bacterium]
MKAFIVAAGYGTRNLPATKTLAKELFPIFDRTVMDFILDECEEAGITDLVILINRRKKALEDYFDRDPELEALLTKAGKKEELALIKRATKFNVIFIRQQEMKGTGHAILSAKSLLQDAPFIAFFPDDIILGEIGGAKQLLEVYNQTKCSVLAAREELENISAYGVIEYKEQNNLSYVTRIVEKPKTGEIDSNLVSVGRFIYTPEFLEALEEDYKSHTTGEFYPMGAMMSIAQKGKLFVKKLEGKVLDTGNHKAYLKTFLEYADSTPEGNQIINQFIENRK